MHNNKQKENSDAHTDGKNIWANKNLIRKYTVITPRVIYMKNQQGNKQETQNPFIHVCKYMPAGTFHEYDTK